MLIKEFIRRDYKTVGPYQWVQGIKHDLASNNALVVMEDGTYLGVLTSRDVVVKSHNLVIDCVLPKSPITSRHFIDHVLELMDEENTDVLPVVEDGQFDGVVFKNDLIGRLFTIIEKQKHHVRSIVHDLRNPITNISSLTSLLKSDGSHNPQELLEYTEQACSFANEIINELLMVSEIEDDQAPTKNEQTEITGFLRESISSCRGAMVAKNITLSEFLPNTPFYLSIDRIKLHRALFNLLSNAVKFTPEGGNITVSAESTDAMITISIADTGIGIPESMQPVIFEKFTKAKRFGTNGENSTGLGMYITKQLVELQGGRIWLESEEGKGTTFYIEFKGGSSIPS